MFLIAGVSPKTRQVDAVTQRCSFCGLHQAYLTRIDHYLSLFFIPLFPVKKGPSFLYCNHCQRECGQGQAAAKTDMAKTCGRCGSRLEAHFSYCPACGQRC